MTAPIQERIRAALKVQVAGDTFGAAPGLLKELGYRSSRTPPGQTGKPADFVRQFPANNPNTQSERSFLQEAQSIRILFQFTDTEMAREVQKGLFDTNGDDFNSGNARSFLFTAMTLRSNSYSRGQYAAFTRELNKRIPIPVVALFCTADGRVTLAFVHRRPNRHNSERDVLGNVSLIREIDPAAPHRAHLDILSELSLPTRLSWMDDHGKSRNFDGLLDAWLNTLDTEELNRRFYCELFDWFERAVVVARFPADEKQSPAQHVIRLITRLMFTWFIKEKGLVANDLFVEHQVAGLLKNYDCVAGDSYYRAVLQNLFFATLNTEIGQRRFSTRTLDDRRNFSVYRYQDEIANPDRLFSLFAKTPFINGGLFDCLDILADTDAGDVRVDCFTDNPEHRSDYSIPNHLFFGDDAHLGLIDLFHRYRFTVEENTPVEQEVALDPELLGKVFENLLAAVNPETQLTARKTTGSYYTPRPVVNYMVDEALVSILAQKAGPEDGNIDCWQTRLRYLLDYNDAFNDANELFTPVERKDIVRAIAKLKTMDPAVGSGAFPMGILHKLTLILRRLDPDNIQWEKLQQELAGRRANDAFGIGNQAERDEILGEISATFERYRDSDYGRKLYLIQNTIYGVDIQPVAVQIAKLRFFISLAIEQRRSSDASNNYDIKPLPNLETRFVAADTLLGLHDIQATLTSPRAQDLQLKLQANRERHFHTSDRGQKDDCNVRDQALRRHLANELRQLGMPLGDADKYAAWNPYDQNAGATDWFDARYMFNVNDGFDIVIGNPPYIESRNSLLSNKLKDAYGNQIQADWGKKLPRGSDLLIYFLARSPKFMHDTGIGCLITQNAWLSTDYGKRFQDFSLDKFSFTKIVDTSEKFFSDTRSQNINAVVVNFGKVPSAVIEYCLVDGDMKTVESKTKTIMTRQKMKWGHCIAMPMFFADILSDLADATNTRDAITFGQGLNDPKWKLRLGSNTPVIVDDVSFVATSADGSIDWVSSNRRNRIPALIMPRGIGDRFYCTFNVCKAFSYSKVELYIANELWGSDLHYCLWAYLNSSLVWLFREITGRKNLGGGMLKAEATDMKVLPINFKFDFAEQAKQVFATLKDRVPLPLAREIVTEEHLLIDEMVANFFGITGKEDDIRNALLERVNFRNARSQQ